MASKSIRPLCSYGRTLSFMIVLAVPCGCTSHRSQNIAVQSSADTIAPTGTVVPATGAFLGPTEPIVITYNESIDPSSVALSGELVSGGAASVITTTATANDTLTITPASTWPDGLDQSLRVTASDLAGNSVSIDLTYSLDNTAPTATPTPSSGSVIEVDTQLVIHFDEGIAPDSLVLSGALANQCGIPSWSSVATLNDTVTLSPVTGWATGEGQTLTIAATDLHGNGIVPVDLTYTVVGAIAYVRTPENGGDDANPGTADAPFATIKHAVDDVAARVGSNGGRVLVAAGTYTVADVADQIAVADGVSIYGGYDPTSFVVRDPSVNVSRIVDTRSSGGSLSEPSAPVSLGVVTSATVLDGLQIQAGGGDYSAGVYVAGGSPTLHALTVDGGTGALTAGGVWIAAGDAHISNSAVSGGTTQGTGSAYAIVGDANSALVIEHCSVMGGVGGITAVGISCSSCLVTDNIVSPGIASNSTTGIDVRGSGSVVRSNTVLPADSAISGSDAWAIAVAGTSVTVVENHVLAGGNGNYLSVSLVLESGDATVERNVFDAGRADGTTVSVYAEGGSLTLRNNLIGGGDGQGTSGVVILSSATAPVIQNNDIDGGAGTVGAVAIELWVSGAIIENNILFTRGSAAAICIEERWTTSDPSAVRNNDFFDCATGLYSDEGVTYRTLIDDVNNATKTTGGAADSSTGNVSVRPVWVSPAGPDTLPGTLADNDWRLAGDADANLRLGGLDLSPGFAADFDGTLRTADLTTCAADCPLNTGAAGWSIGAYEH